MPDFALLGKYTIVGTCDGGDCDRRAVSLAFDERAGCLIPVCLAHILVYRVRVRNLWQAEDEFAGLRFARRSRFRIIAQWRILQDQRAAMRGHESRAQRRMRLRAVRKLSSSQGEGGEQ